eukprot:TRINITY_DN18904_c0_g1_i3.p1 TRINITY_DN18904_c0_g1~~TRINITY_DN18904_c0_g1_i3.p1  ORF type:complete len:353 (+),score=87.32 TRINITY_DN18904_c0_g1_i3:299-1357(+)
MVREVMKQMASPDPRTSTEAVAERRKQLEEYELQTASNATTSSAGALPSMQELLLEVVGLTALEPFRAKVEACKHNKERLELWDQLKLLAFTQAVGSMYTVVFQDTLRRVQIYIVEAHRVRCQLAKAAGGGEMGDLMALMGGQPGAPGETEEDVLMKEGAEFLMMSATTGGYFQTHHATHFVQHLKTEVSHQFAGLDMKTMLDEASLKEHLRELRVKIEGESAAQLFRKYFVPPDPPDHTNETIPLFEAQMKDLMDCHDFSLMLQSKLDQAFGMLCAHYNKMLFSQDSMAMSRVGASPVKAADRKRWPLAKVLPVTKRAHEIYFDPTAVAQLNSSQEVTDFFSLIYTSMERV